MDAKCGAEQMAKWDADVREIYTALLETRQIEFHQHTLDYVPDERHIKQKRSGHRYKPRRLQSQKRRHNNATSPGV